MGQAMPDEVRECRPDRREVRPGTVTTTFVAGHRTMACALGGRNLRPPSTNHDEDNRDWSSRTLGMRMAMTLPNRFRSSPSGR